MSHSEGKDCDPKLGLPGASLSYSHLCFIISGTKVTSVLTCREAGRDREWLEHCTAVFCSSQISSWFFLPELLFNSESNFAFSTMAALTCGVSRHGNLTVGGKCFQPTRFWLKWLPQVEPDLTLSTDGSVLPTMPPGDSATGGCVSSVYPLTVGIRKAKACFQVTATKQAWAVRESGAPVLLAGQVPDGERSLPGFYSLPLFSHRS